MVDSTLAFFASTQHTLSTFCSTLGDDDDDDDDISGCWNDDDISLESFHDGYQFDCPTLRLEDNVDEALQQPITMTNNNTSIAQSMIIGFNNSNVTGNIQGDSHEQIYGDDIDSSLFANYSQESSMFCGASRVPCQKHDMMIDGPHQDTSTKHGLNDSMTSLSEAFAKLDYCMLRTAQSRKLVRQLTEKLALSPSIPLPSTSTTTTTRRMKTDDQLLRSNSSSSLNCNGSVASRSHRKGPKSFHKTRRNNKASLSNKTGVAIRTLLNASFS